MKKRGLTAGIGAVLLLIIVISVYGAQRKDPVPVIGVLMWDDGTELSQTAFEYLDWMDGILDADVKVMRISWKNDLAEMVENFCQEGGDVLINVVSQDFPEIMQICEQYQVYLLQMWEMSMDTDILEKAMNHQYFLGCILSDDDDAADKMAEALNGEGSEEIAILTYNYENNMSNAQQRRNLSFRKALGEREPAANLEIYSFDEGIRYLARLNERIDGLLMSERLMEYSVQTAKEIMGKEAIKFAYFDVNEFSLEDLEEGSLAMVACGQQNVVELAVAYADAFVENGKCWEEKLMLECPYIYLTSPEEYDRYQEFCVAEPAYSEAMVSRLVDSLEDGIGLLEEYAKSYSLSWLEEQKSSENGVTVSDISPE